MSEAEKDTRIDNKETQDANMNQSGSETEQNKAKKFTVERQDIAVPPRMNADGLAEPSGTESLQTPTSTTSSPQVTCGYATNEAMPMTVFYRSQHSQGHSGKQRPTLQQLRKGFENDKVRELMMSHKINSCISQGLGGRESGFLFLHESSCKILRLCFHKMRNV